MTTIAEVTVGVYTTRNGMRATVFSTSTAPYGARPVRGLVWDPKDVHRPAALYATWSLDGRRSLVGEDAWDLIERLPDKAEEAAAIALGASETGEGIPDPTPTTTGPEIAWK